MNRRRKIRSRIGDVVSIPMGDGQLAFGWVLQTPLVAFFEHNREDQVIPDAEFIVKRPIAFRLWVMQHVLSDGLWPIIGHVAVPAELLDLPWFFKRDAISGKFSLTKTGAEEIPADAERCKSLECAAVWDPEHVVDRLQDHFAGRSNKWVESMRVK